MEEEKSTPVKILFAKPLFHWWQGLEDDRASRAVLRRCATLDAVSLSDAYQRFYRYMLACGWPENSSEWQRDKLAAIAGLVAHVKTNDGNQGDFDDTQRLPARMSEVRGDRPLVSEIRFRDLLKVETTADLFAKLRRILPLIDHQASVSVAATGWSDTWRSAIADNVSRGVVVVAGAGNVGMDLYGDGDLYVNLRVVLPPGGDPDLEALARFMRDQKPYKVRD